MILKVDEELFSGELRGSAVAALVEVSPVASFLLLAEASVEKLSSILDHN